MSYRKGTKVYFKVGKHAGYRKGIVLQVLSSPNSRSKEYVIKPTDAGSKPAIKYWVKGSNTRRR